MTAGSGHGSPTNHITVGKVLGPHGVRGDVRVLPLTDFPQRFRHGSYLYLNGQEVMVEGSRPLRGLLIVKFQGVDTRNHAEEIQGADLTVPEEALQPLPPGEYYRHQIMGLTVWSREGMRLGVITDILPTGSNDVFLVQGEGKEYVIPHIQDIVREVDLDRKRMIIEVVPGLLD
jgi:16S rRNA processing protein RimM